MHSIRSSHDFRSAKPLRFALGWRPVPGIGDMLDWFCPDPGSERLRERRHSICRRVTCPVAPIIVGHPKSSPNWFREKSPRYTGILHKRTLKIYGELFEDHRTSGNRVGLASVAQKLCPSLYRRSPFRRQKRLRTL